MDPTKDNIEIVVRGVISRLSGLNATDIDPDAHFIKDLGIDSVNVVELTVALEKNFKVTIDDLIIVNMSTINVTVKTVLSII